MKEEFRTINGYENYEVSNLGRVRNKKTGRILNARAKHGGYIQVTLSNNGKAKDFTVHRLVCKTFIPNPNNLPEINHKDENRTNNNVNNLEWCDRSYNINYGTRNKQLSKIFGKSTLQFDLNGNFIREWDSASTAARELGYSQTAICKCCRHEVQTMYGFIWRYKKV